MGDIPKAVGLARNGLAYCGEAGIVTLKVGSPRRSIAQANRRFRETERKIQTFTN